MTRGQYFLENRSIQSMITRRGWSTEASHYLCSKREEKAESGHINTDRDEIKPPLLLSEVGGLSKILLRIENAVRYYQGPSDLEQTVIELWFFWDIEAFFLENVGLALIVTDVLIFLLKFLPRAKFDRPTTGLSEFEIFSRHLWGYFSRIRLKYCP